VYIATHIVTFRATRVLLACCVVLFAAAPLPAPGAETEEDRTRTRLERLKRDMARLGEELARDAQQRGSLRAALRQSEIAIGNIRGDMDDTRDRLARSRDELEELRGRRRELLVAQGEQRKLIVREIRAAYRMGKQGQLKMLLNQERPDTLARVLTYYDYFYRARREHIDRYLGIIERMDALEPEIANTARQLEATRRTLAAQETQLLASKQRRRQDLAGLEADIASKDRQLQKMERDREELERLLEVIEQAVADLRLSPESENFLALKGRMPWPVTGRPENRFGGSRGAGKQRWQGLNIPAEEGSSVTAIHNGRVVFADWFRGSGLLLIVDHGEGYMSLYAHNQALLREVGEWVGAGAAIATVGNSGGRREAALYFEIRHNGRPVDPAGWLAAG